MTMTIAKLIVTVLATAAYTSAWWSFAVFGQPDGNERLYMVPSVCLVVLGTGCILVFSAMWLGTNWNGKGK
jgi:hypothetical protein